MSYPKEDPYHILNTLRKGDKEIIIKTLQTNKKFFYTYGALSSDLHHLIRYDKRFTDIDVIIAALECDLGLFQYAPDKVKNDKEKVLKLYDREFVFQYISEILKDDEEVVLKFATNSRDLKCEYINREKMEVKYASTRLKDNKDFVLKLIKIPHVLYHVSDRLKNDKDLIRAFVEINSHDFIFASSSLKNDKEFVLELSKYPNILDEVSKTLKDDESVALAFLTNPSNKECIFQYLYKISNRLRENKYFNLKLRKTCIKLGHLSVILRDDKDIVREWVMKNHKQIIFASDRLKNDKEFMIEMIINYGDVFNFVSHVLKTDKDVIYAALNSNNPAYNVLENIPEETYNKQDVLRLVSQCGRILKYAPDKFKNDIDIVLTSVEKDGWALNYASSSLKRNKVVFTTALKSVIKSIENSGFDTYRMYNDNRSLLYSDDDKRFEKKYKSDRKKSVKELGIFKFDYIHCHIREVLKTFDHFYVFLYGTIKRECLLQKLKKHGQHHSIKFLKYIADFVGITYGPKIITYRNALSKLLLSNST